MNDYQRGLREIIAGHRMEATGVADNLAIALCTYFESHPNCPDDDETERGWQRWAEDNANRVIDEIAEAIRAEAEKVAESAPIAEPVAWMLRKKSSGFICGLSAAPPSDEILPDAEIDGDEWVPLYSAPSAPDEALIEEIAERHSLRRAPLFFCIKDAIREYLKRREHA